MDDREYDITMLEIKLNNDMLEQEFYLHKLGIRARYQDAQTQDEEAIQATEEILPI